MTRWCHSIVGGSSPKVCLLWVLRVHRAGTQTGPHCEPTRSDVSRPWWVCQQSEVSEEEEEEEQDGALFMHLEADLSNFSLEIEDELKIKKWE